MLKDLICGRQVYVVTGYTDLRKSIDGLAAIVQGQLEVDVFSNGVLLFCGSAALYSIVSTAQANGLDAEKYLTELFRQPAGTIILPWKEENSDDT